MTSRLCISDASRTGGERIHHEIPSSGIFINASFRGHDSIMSGFLLPYHTLLLPYHILSLLLFSQLASCLDVPIPLTAPADAFSVSQSFVSFSIEADLWTDWVGTTSRNDFFFNTLDNLQQLTGMPPQIRIGGNSEDHINFRDNVQVLYCSYVSKFLSNRRCQVTETVFPIATTVSPYPEATNITIGDAYYDAAKFLPQSMNSFPLFRFFFYWLHISIDTDTHVTWGLNLGRNNLSAAFLEAKALVNAFKSSSIKTAGIVLEAIEIGNEADLYSNNGARPKGFTSKEYVAECVLISLPARSIFTHIIPPCQMD